MYRQRPLGVTFVAILTIIGGLLLFLVGTTFMLLPFTFSTIVDNPALLNNTQNELGINSTQFQELTVSILNFTNPVFYIAGVVLIVFAIIDFVLFFGLLKGKGWSWTGAVILSSITLVFGVISIILFVITFGSTSQQILSSNIVNIIFMAVNGIIIYYLFSPKVKFYFGKVKHDFSEFR